MAIRGCSQRLIASALGISRNTVAKYASATPSPEPPVRRARESPATGLYEDLVCGWPASDLAAPPKQRHTARRASGRLVDEGGFRGSLSTAWCTTAGFSGSGDSPTA